ncbi:MAG: glycosyltransferase family 1 protein [Thermoleophilia bacterium]
MPDALVSPAGPGDRPLVVVMDARMARRRRTGVATYVNGLIPALAALGEPVTVHAVHGPPPLPRRNALTSVGNLLLDLAWTHVMLPALALRHRADVLHATFNWAPAWCPRPVVVTIHDLAWEVMPEAYPGGFRRFASLFTRLSARRAQRIIAVSRSTRDDLVQRYGVAPDRVAVVYTGIAPRRPADEHPEHVILAVGEYEPRKRVPDLVEAHRRYLRDAPPQPAPCTLVLAGAGGADEARVRAMAGPGCRVAGFVSDDELDRLYRCATLFVCNSAYEGFGLPVAEAAGAGCPVLVADTPALREAGGPEALVVDGDGPEALAAALRDALADRAALRARGAGLRAHARTLSWEACAAGTLAAYRAVVRT